MKRKLCLLLTAVLVCGVLSVPALAAEMEQTAETVQEAPADPEGTVSWQNLRSRIQEGSLTAQTLAENINSVESMDYDKMAETLRKQVNDLAKAMLMTTLSGGDSSSMKSSYEALKDSLDAIVDGELQEDHADTVWQLTNSSNQLLQTGETLYITLLGLEQSAEDLQRSLDALDRQIEDAELRLELGRGSRETVCSLRQTRSETASSLASLNTNLTNGKSQLQSMLGEDPTGELTLGALPTAEEMEWQQPDYEADLAAARESSWKLRSAQVTLEDAKETWEDAQDDYNKPAKKYLLEMAEHTWNAAQLTYQSEVQDFEMSFRELYDSLSDYEQTWESKCSAVEYRETQLTATEKKYELGRASRYDVLNAQDQLASAQSAADSAWRDLFSARNRYQWAVECGLL